MSDTPPEIELSPGDTVGERYRVVRAIGRGGIGVVYEAENTWTRRRVAIKLLQTKVANDPEQVERFRQEAQTTSGLRHPNIVDILDMGPDPVTGRLFMVQELLDGDTLQAHLEAKKRLAPREAFDIMVPVMGALAAAHARGVLHRDIKPGNIFLARDPNGDALPKIIDFGLARLLHDDPELRKTRSGSIVGTPYYMAPEQARGESGIDARIDVWAVGAVLYELLTGEVPFDGQNALAVMWKIASGPATRVDALVPGLPSEVADIVAGALKNKRDERFASMEALLEAALACPALATPDAPSLAVQHARSLPPELARRSSVPTVRLSMAPRDEALALIPTLLASPTKNQSPTDLRATPFGWSSRRALSSRRARRLAPFAIVGLAIAVALPLVARLARPGSSSPASAASVTRSLPPSLPAPPAIQSAVVQASPGVQPPMAAPDAVRDASVAAMPAQPAAVAAAHGARGRRPGASAPARPTPTTRPTLAPPHAPAASPPRRTATYDPEQLLENTR